MEATSLQPTTVFNEQGLELNRRIQGRLVFSGENLGLIDYKVNLFIRGIFGIKQFIGSAKTDSDGNFYLQYGWNPCFLVRTQRIVLAVVEKRRPFASQGVLCIKKEIPIELVEKEFSRNDLRIDLKDVPLTFAQIPSTLTGVIKPQTTHRQSPAWYLKLVKAVALEGVKRLIAYVFKRFLSAGQVQGLYSLFGSKYPVRPLTAQNLLHELLNEVSAVDYTDEEGRITWNAVWDDYTLDIKGSLPNVTVVAVKTEDELRLESIVITFREDEYPEIVGPEDNRLPWAIYIARSTFALKGEAEVHLGLGHIMPHLVAKPFFKHIRPGNPLFEFAPHLGQAHSINYLGSKGIIYGEGSVLEVSALEADSIASLIVNSLQDKADYTQFAPSEPLIPNHYRAQAQKDYYYCLKEFFQTFVQENKDGIVSHWQQVYRFSSGMHKRFNKIPLVTSSENGPQEGDLERLALLLAWVVNLTTFLHWASHSRQGILADTRSASLAIREKALNADHTFNNYGNTSPEAVSLQNFIARSLLNWEGDPLIKDPYGNMNPKLLKKVQEVLEIIKRNNPGFSDIEKMHVATQI